MTESLFSLSDMPFAEAETVISVFVRSDGEIFIECADQLKGFGSKLVSEFGDDVLSSEARLFAYNYALLGLDFYKALVPAENCGKIICDMQYMPQDEPFPSIAKRLDGSENYPHMLDDIKLGAENGYACYGVVEENNVLCAAYSFIPEDDIDVEVEIGVETVPEHRGRGFAYESVTALASYLYEKGHEVIYSYYEENPASARLAEKCSFVNFANGFEIILERGV